MTKLISVVLITVVASACTGANDAATTMVSSTTTTTALPTTTTTEAETTTTLPPVVEIEGAGARLVNSIAAYYGYATGRNPVEPAGVPKELLPTPGAHADLGTVQGEVAAADYKGTRIAVFQSGKDVLGLVLREDGWRMIGGRAPSIGVRAWYGNAPMLVAVVGSDARPGEDVTETRADSIHILGLDGKGGAALVGIPRDSYVPIPGYGTSKINASLQAGGPEMMMATFEELSGLEFDGYALTGFEGFEALVDEVLLPFELDVPSAFSDRAAKADFEEGTQVVDGRDALAFGRTRKAFLTGDFQRQFNGGLLLIAALGGAKLRGPLAFPSIISATEPWLITDLTAGQLLRFALAANHVKLTDVDNIVLEGSNATASGGASIVRLNQSAAEAVFADLADGNLD